MNKENAMAERSFPAEVYLTNEDDGEGADMLSNWASKSDAEACGGGEGIVATYVLKSVSVSPIPTKGK